MDTLLWPLKVAVAWVMVYIHKLLVLLGMPDGPGIAWVLSIIGLTIVVRIIIMPLFVKQIRAQRGMQLMQPELQALQAKYKGKQDPESKRRQQEEMMALYRKHGTNPLASCLPILVQMPIFFALFRVLANLEKVATGTYSGRSSIGPLTAELADQVQRSTVFGAPLSASFMNSDEMLVKVVTVVLIVIMAVTQWYTMAQLSMKNMPQTAKDNPMMRSQSLMMKIMPVFFALTGVQFQIGVLVYWVTTNLWTMGQQFFAIRNMPAPGSEAEKKYRARVNAKRARKGLPSLEEEEKAQAIAEGRVVGGQRPQPVSKKRQKKRSLPLTVEEQYAASRAQNDASAGTSAEAGTEGDDVASSSQSGDTPGGLTPEEIARRRYEKRARQRQQAAAKRRAQNKRKQN